MDEPKYVQQMRESPRFGVDAKGTVHELKPWEPDEFTDRHELMCRMSLTMRNNEIADLFGMSQGKVSTVLNDPRAAAIKREAQQAIQHSLADVTARLAMGANAALDVLEEQIADRTLKAKDRRHSAIAWLDRAGYSKVEKKIVAHTVIDSAVATVVSDALRESAELMEEADYSLVEVEE